MCAAWIREWTTTFIPINHQTIMIFSVARIVNYYWDLVVHREHITTSFFYRSCYREDGFPLPHKRNLKFHNILLISLQCSWQLLFQHVLRTNNSINNFTHGEHLNTSQCRLRMREVSGFCEQTSLVIDGVADMWLSTVVQCIEKQLKLLRRLATEHWQ